MMGGGDQAARFPAPVRTRRRSTSCFESEPCWEHGARIVGVGHRPPPARRGVNSRRPGMPHTHVERGRFPSRCTGRRWGTTATSRIGAQWAREPARFSRPSGSSCTRSNAKRAPGPSLRASGGGTPTSLLSGPSSSRWGTAEGEHLGDNSLVEVFPVGSVSRPLRSSGQPRGATRRPAIPKRAPPGFVGSRSGQPRTPRGRFSGSAFPDGERSTPAAPPATAWNREISRWGRRRFSRAARTKRVRERPGGRGRESVKKTSNGPALGVHSTRARRHAPATRVKRRRSSLDLLQGRRGARSARASKRPLIRCRTIW